MKERNLFSKILRDNGFSVTKARSLIFDLLLSADGARTMHQLIESTEGRVDRVSVYRIIELYEKLGMVQRINIGWKYRIELSDVFLDHHHHMACLGCGRVVAVKDEPTFEVMIERLGKVNGFVLKSHQLEMQGYCTHCQPAHL